MCKVLGNITMFFMDFWTYRAMFMLIIMCHNAHVDCTVRVNGKRVSVRNAHCLHVRLPVTTFCSCCGCDEDGNARTSIGLQNGMCVFEVNQKENCQKNCNNCTKKGGLWEKILPSRKLVWACFDRVLLCLFMGIGDILETHRELHCSWIIFIFFIVSMITVKGLLDKQVLMCITKKVYIKKG